MAAKRFHPFYTNTAFVFRLHCHSAAFLQQHLVLFLLFEIYPEPLQGPVQSKQIDVETKCKRQREKCILNSVYLNMMGLP